MVLIPGGLYTIGGGVGGEMRDVEVAPFFIDTHEVTNEKFARFLNDVYPEAKEDWLLWVNTEKGSEFKIVFKESEEGNGGVFSVVEGYKKHPVVTVSWDGAVAYTEWEGKTLPTVVQWEVAARGKSTDRFPWGDKIDPDRANYRTDVQRKEKIKGTAMPVGSYPPNEFGLYDVVGNVWEWTIDESETDFLSAVSFIDSLSSMTNPLKVLVGGSFLTSEKEIGVSLSFPANQKARFGNIGFRCVKPAE
jgi:formylglycine-generating enzyme required for sulfatase activity